MAPACLPERQLRPAGQLGHGAAARSSLNRPAPLATYDPGWARPESARDDTTAVVNGRAVERVVERDAARIECKQRFGCDSLCYLCRLRHECEVAGHS